MISRIWHGWTNRENADAYEELLRTEIFANIEKQSISGYRGIHLLRRDIDDGVEFVTIMWFDTLEAVKTFAGEEYQVAVVPPEARQLLSRFDNHSAHYQVIAAPE
ncbi:MAG: antibiotic biosynthesis monooxygenase family protein [Promethearchaeota archaeon]